MHEKEFLLNKIESDLEDNNEKGIQEHELREVLAFMLDRWFSDHEIKVTANGLNASDLKSALEELHGSLSAMTGQQIVAALQGLNYEDFLSSAFIKHHYGLTVSDELGYLNTRLDITWYEGRIYHLGSIAYRNGVIYRSMQNDNAGNEPPNVVWWKPVTGIGVLSKEDLAALLNQIEEAGDMIRSDRVSYGSVTVKDKLDNMQTVLSSKRITYSDPPSNVLTVTGVSKPVIQMAVNRVPYQGIQSDDFSGAANGYDFIFRFDGSDIQIMLHPSLDFNFTPDDLIDLIF